MTQLPNLTGTSLVIYEKSVRHHHGNDVDDLNVQFKLLYLVEFENLGVRLSVTDENPTSTTTVDVAIVFHWDRAVTAEDDLEGFVEDSGIPQVLAAASTLIVDLTTPLGVGGVYEAPDALRGLVETFRSREKRLYDLIDFSEQDGK